SLEAKVAQIEEQQGALAPSRQHGTGMHFAVLLHIGHIVNALPYLQAHIKQRGQFARQQLHGPFLARDADWATCAPRGLTSFHPAPAPLGQMGPELPTTARKATAGSKRLACG